MDIVRFKGGLGNQMFQYAFVEALRSRGRNVKGSLGFYYDHPRLAPFILDNVFKNIDLEKVEEEIFNEINERWKRIKGNPELLRKFKKNIKKRFFYVEENDGIYEEEVFKTEECVFVGYWQTEKYFKSIRNILLNDFEFEFAEEKLERIKNKFQSSKCYIAVHVRRGDYLDHQELWGNLGESNYYHDAIMFIKNKIFNPKLVFFSDDIQWVKQNLKFDEAIYIESSMFDFYQPWYDMCLMSCCAHNIIANSSFSWWAAWLNKNKEKIVIAPEKWFVDEKRFKDICPNEWIKIKNNNATW